MKTKLKIGFIAFLLCTTAVFKTVAQTVIKTATIIPFVDANNNCIKDLGEITINTNDLFNSVYLKTPITGYNYGAIGAFHFSGCNDSLSGYIQFLNASYASAVTSYSLYTDNIDKYLQPCFNPNNIPFNTVTYIPFKSTIIGNELISSKHIYYRPATGGTYGNASPNGCTICKSDTVKFFQSHYASGGCVSSPTLTPGTATVIVKSDGIVIDTYTYSIIIDNNNYNYFGINSSLGVRDDNTSYLCRVSPSPSILNGYSIGSHTVTVIHSPIFGITMPIVEEYWFNITNNCSQIVGSAFVDCNNNCTQDGSEAYTSQQASQLNLSSLSNQYSFYPNVNGNFTYLNIPPDTYTVNAVITNSNYILCPLSSNTIIIGSSTVYTINYGVQQTTTTTPVDYHTNILLSNANPGPGAVPGGTFNVNVYNGVNGGNLCSPTINPNKLKVILPPLMAFNNIIGSTPIPSAFIFAPSGDTIVWNSPLASGLHQFSVITATNILMGSPYCITSIIYPLSDANPINNTYSLCDSIGGPFDPNEKISEATNMSTNGNILPSTNELTYSIYFQNLGNGSAVNVLIKDSISLNLNLSTLEVLASSFPVETFINNNSREVQFKFNNIFLHPASNNEPASHGFVKYKIKLNIGLPVGTTIKNSAHIYFDYNSAISTNQTNNTIAIPSSIVKNEQNQLMKIWPNPTKNNITINALSIINSIQITNALGQLVLSKNNVNETNTTLDVTGLQIGIYFVQLQTKEGNVIKKIIKE